MPKRCGSGTCFSRIWAAGGSSDVRAASKAATNAAEILLQQVVAEVHHEVVVAEEVAGDEHAVGQPERRVLGDVGDLGAEVAAVADGGADLGPVSPMITPISVMPAATIASMP